MRSFPSAPVTAACVVVGASVVVVLDVEDEDELVVDVVVVVVLVDVVAVVVVVVLVAAHVNSPTRTASMAALSDATPSTQLLGLLLWESVEYGKTCDAPITNDPAHFVLCHIVIQYHEHDERREREKATAYDDGETCANTSTQLQNRQPQ